jgi:chaperonin GroES
VECQEWVSNHLLIILENILTSNNKQWRTEMAVQPLEDRILIMPLERETQTASGIFLPESATEKPMQGKVVAMGPGKLLDSGERVKPVVKKGDTVVFGRYSGTEIEIKGTTHLIVREGELLGMIDG